MITRSPYIRRPGRRSYADFYTMGGRSLLSRASGLWIPDAYDSVTDSLTNQRPASGISGARLGSAAGSDTNDPSLLTYAGDKYLSLPGTSGNNASTPSAAANQITGDIGLWAKIAADDYTPASTSAIVGKYLTTGNQRSYLLSYNGSGNLVLGFSTDGTLAGVIERTSTVVVPFADREAAYAGATLDVDNGAGGHTVKFYTSTDGAAWNQLGATVTTAGVINIFNSTSVLESGSINLGTSQLSAIKVFWAGVSNTLTVNPSLVQKFNASDFTSESTTAASSATGENWTINRATAAGAKAQIIDRTCILGNLSDYCIVTSGMPTIGTGDFTIGGVMLVPFANPASNTGGCWYLGPSNAANAGINAFYAYIDTSGQLLIIKNDAAGASQTVATVAGFRATYSGKWVALTASRAGGTWVVSANGNLIVTNTTFGSEAVGSTYLGIGTNASTYADYPITKTAFFTRALSLDEHRRLAVEMGASV